MDNTTNRIQGILLRNRRGIVRELVVALLVTIGVVGGAGAVGNAVAQLPQRASHPTLVAAR